MGAKDKCSQHEGQAHSATLNAGTCSGFVTSRSAVLADMANKEAALSPNALMLESLQREL